MAVLADLHEAVRLRVLRAAALAAGALPAELATVHLDDLDRLVTAWHGQKWVDLPGHLRASRSDGVAGVRVGGVSGCRLPGRPGNLGLVRCRDG